MTWISQTWRGRQLLRPQWPCDLVDSPRHGFRDLDLSMLTWTWGSDSTVAMWLYSTDLGMTLQHWIKVDLMWLFSFLFFLHLLKHFFCSCQSEIYKGIYINIIAPKWPWNVWNCCWLEAETFTQCRIINVLWVLCRKLNVLHVFTSLSGRRLRSVWNLHHPAVHSSELVWYLLQVRWTYSTGGPWTLSHELILAFLNYIF